MLALTDDAAGYLTEMLSSDTLGGRPVVRIARTEESWTVHLDRVRRGDEVIEQDGQPLVAYADELAPALENARLDVRTEGAEAELVLTPQSIDGAEGAKAAD